MHRVTLKIVASDSAPRLSRQHLADIRPFLEPRYDDVALVVSELVSNSVRHVPDGREIELTVKADADAIRIEVSDEGHGFDHVKSNGDGMGLRLVDLLSERWGVDRSRRFKVWAELTKESALDHSPRTVHHSNR